MKKVSLQEAFDRCKPENVYCVISVDKNNQPNIMTLCWAMKCSKNPPMFAISLSKKGYTHKLIQKSKEFVIAIPNKKLEKEVDFFGTTHGDKVDKFKATSIKTAKANFVKSPLLKDATVNFECRLLKEIDSGDHIMFIGEILASYINPNKKVLLNMKRVNDKHIYEEI